MHAAIRYTCNYQLKMCLCSSGRYSTVEPAFMKTQYSKTYCMGYNYTVLPPCTTLRIGLFTIKAMECADAVISFLLERESLNS